MYVDPPIQTKLFEWGGQFQLRVLLFMYVDPPIQSKLFEWGGQFQLRALFYVREIFQQFRIHYEKIDSKKQHKENLFSIV